MNRPEGRLAVERTPEEIRRDIERTREGLALALLELQDDVTTAIDWRMWVRRKPVPFLAAAFGAGVLAGLL